MLNLTKGEYLGSVSKSIAAGGLIIGITDYRSGQSHSPLHAHENAHFSLVLKGTMVVGRKRHSGLQTAAERFSYIQSGEQHQTRLGTSSGKNINLEIEPAFLRRYDLNECHVTQMARSPGAMLMMLRFYNELQKANPCFTDHIDFLVLSLLQDRNKLSKVAPPSWVVILRDLLNVNWDKELSLQQLSEAAGVHPVTISKSFHRYFGCGLGDYRRRIKLERAVELIASGNSSLTSVACACGFFDQSHFIKSFKAGTGMLPKHLRFLSAIQDG
ncbi:helix-turn-helix transcriptional regulator [Parapedobacter sp. ISTM3]|uniref:helix-turn-helix domain-containing protein n=1 Tax=Parapedobacter sp. ISTM3 TaxID=2800130 RepID=UPI001902F812|nr:helix-turn-helix domain-containing protein [Parapedobacter sp. ISTM3]MBK1439421.1 helix-turn-helix transcriptional regulator [Parapedobacter sp. ISTM3]